MKIEERVIRHYARLNQTDLFIWNYIMKNKKECSRLSIDVLANRCSVSRTTISRFVKKLGYKGYSEFKVVIGWEDDDSSQMDEEAFEIACESIIKYVENQKNKDYGIVNRYLYEAKRIFVYGSGDIQNAVAKQIKRMFLSCQEIIYDFGGTTFDEAIFHLISSEDVIVIISLSGNSEETLHIARQLKLNGIKIISITEFKDNRLTQLADESIYISATQLQLLTYHPQFKTTMLYFVLAELLFIKYSIYKKKRLLKEGKECQL